MLALLPDDYKPNFILRGLFLHHLPTEVWSHLLQEKISDPWALALKGDELFQSKKSSLWTSLLTSPMIQLRWILLYLMYDLASKILYSSSVGQNSSFSGSVLVSQETWKQSCQLQETVCSLGKLVGRQVKNSIQPASFIPIWISASVPAEQEVCCSSLLFLRDILSDRDFLVDFGASVSVLPGPASTSTDEVRLLTADRTSLYCSGTRIIPLRFSCGSDSKVYSWNFHLAPVSVPLLGADFLQHFDLLVDVKGHQLVHAQCP